MELQKQTAKRVLSLRTKKFPSQLPPHSVRHSKRISSCILTVGLEVVWKPSTGLLDNCLITVLAAVISLPWGKVACGIKILGGCLQRFGKAKEKTFDKSLFAVSSFDLGENFGWPLGLRLFKLNWKRVPRHVQGPGTILRTSLLGSEAHLQVDAKIEAWDILMNFPI